LWIAIDMGDISGELMDCESDPAGKELLQPYPLEEFGLAFNLEVKVLVCTGCETGILPNEWKGHLHAQHRAAYQNLCNTFSKEVFGAVEQAITSFAPTDADTAKMRPGALPPVFGIKVESGYYCPVIVDGSPCHKAAGTLKTLQNHFSASHKGSQDIPKPKDRAKYACDYQSIFRGVHRRFFRVIAGGSKDPELADYNALISETGPADFGTTYVDEPELRDQTSLLKVTMWDEFVGPFRKDPENVVNLVALPSWDSTATEEEKALCGLYRVCLAWLQKVKDLWRPASSHVRLALGMA
jgi:Orsellinic acid/F9775 biosynthesis cluster protein D